jgi:hypothetical protein
VRRTGCRPVEESSILFRGALASNQNEHTRKVGSTPTPFTGPSGLQHEGDAGWPATDGKSVATVHCSLNSDAGPYCGVEQPGQLAGLISRRSQVRILSHATKTPNQKVLTRSSMDERQTATLKVRFESANQHSQLGCLERACATGCRPALQAGSWGFNSPQVH